MSSSSNTFQVGDRVRILATSNGSNDKEAGLDAPLNLYGNVQPGDEGTIIKYAANLFGEYGPVFQVRLGHTAQYVRANQIEKVVTGQTAVPPTEGAFNAVESWQAWEKEFEVQDEELKAGDRVRIKSAELEHVQHWVGLELEIVRPVTEVGEPWVKPLSERPDGRGFTQFFSTGFELEKIADSPFVVPTELAGFKVGDRVEITYGFGWSGPGTVTRIAGEYLAVSADSMSGLEGAFLPADIKPLAEETPELKVGDRVEILATMTADLGEEFCAKWRGLRARVAQIHSELGGWLEPETSRPDGHGLNPFYWDADDLKVVEEEPLADWERELLNGEPELTDETGEGAYVHDAEGLNSLPNGTVVYREGTHSETATKVNGRFVRINPLSGPANRVYDWQELAETWLEDTPARVVFIPA